jgi:hypothetical protein
MTSLSRMAMFVTVLRMMQSSLFPHILGGGVREYVQVAMIEPPKADLEELRKLVEAGDLKGVVDSVWEMEDAPKVSEHVVFRYDMLIGFKRPMTDG